MPIVNLQHSLELCHFFVTGDMAHYFFATMRILYLLKYVNVLS